MTEEEKVELAIASYIAKYASTHMNELNDLKERLEDLEATVTSLNKLILHIDYLKDAVLELKTQMTKQSSAMVELHNTYSDARSIVRAISYILATSVGIIAVGASLAQIWSTLN